MAYQVLGDGPFDLLLSPGWVTHLDLAWDVASSKRNRSRQCSGPAIPKETSSFLVEPHMP